MIHFKTYNNANELPDTWDNLGQNDIFLKTPFLKALEKSSPHNISSFYVMIYASETLVGIAIIQRVEMYIDNVFRKTSNNILKQIGKILVSKIVKGNALVVGNLMHTGQHSLFFLEQQISQLDFLNQIQKALNIITIEIKKEFNKKIRIIVFKDYFESDSIHFQSHFFNQNKLHKLQAQPNMIFQIKGSWQHKEDYIAEFTKKYRRRYTTARKKFNGIILKELNLDDIKTNNDILYQLYENVSENARVNSFKLDIHHFYSLKENLKENFKVFAYFLNNKIIGFYTLILNENHLETYFLGYHKDYQHQYQLYLNMLFDMACFGIENNFKTVIYARTAMEIKSSIGAKPKVMHIYLKHTNQFIANTVLKLIVKYMNPMRTWEERHPFKTQNP